MTTSETPPETSLFARPVQHLVDRLTKSRSSIQQTVGHEHLPVTETLELLTPERRQAIFEELAVADRTPISVSTLTERVACTEYACDGEGLEADQRKRVYIALIQSHLPVLEQSSVITYEIDSKLIDRGPEFDRLWQTYSVIIESLI